MANPPTSIEALRDVLLTQPDEALAVFLSQHALGAVAELLVDKMPPVGRAAWVASMRLRYPEAFGPAAIA